MDLQVTVGTSVLIYKASGDECTSQAQEDHRKTTQSQPEMLG